MTVSEWRRKHKRCMWCKHFKLYAVSNSVIAKFIAVCREYKEKYGHMPAYLARQWIKEHKRMRGP